MKPEKLNQKLMGDIANIVFGSELNQSLIELNNFKKACKEAGFSDSDVSEIIKNISAALFFYNLQKKGVQL